MGIDLEIQQTNVVARISILEIPYVPIFIKIEQLWIFQLKVAQKMDIGLEIETSNVGIGINILKILCVCQFSGKTGNFDFFFPNLPKKWI